MFTRCAEAFLCAGQMPNAGARVRVRYALRTADGDLVEERGEGNELEFVVDEGAFG